MRGARQARVARCTCVAHRATRSGVGELYVDDALVADAEIPRSLGVHISPTGLTVGRAPVSPVSELYAPPFRFHSVIDRVTVDLGDDRTAAGPTTITALDD